MTRHRIGISLVIVAWVPGLPVSPGIAAVADLAIADRAACQAVIEEVFWRHRVWPADNPGAKPSLEEVVSPDAFERRAEDALRMSEAVASLDRPVAAADLQAEMDRMALDTRDPEVLTEIFAALNDDPERVAECLARPLLAERRLREVYETDLTLRFARRAETPADPFSVAAGFDAWWGEERGRWKAREDRAAASYALPAIARVACTNDTWAPTNLSNAPPGHFGHTAVWTGAEMIVWGGFVSNSSTSVNTGARYRPATDTWAATATTGAPSPRENHAAVWTGSQMIVWAGTSDFQLAASLSTGGRYNPTSNSWLATATAGVPSARADHAAVWSGSEMIVWGGRSGVGASAAGIGNGGAYNPGTNSWRGVAASGAPSARFEHTAVWTGAEMMVWGGKSTFSATTRLGSGGRYNPVSNTWLPTSSAGAPIARSLHTAVWAGNNMIVWGGLDSGDGFLNTGGRYSAASDSWAPTSTTGAPNHRGAHTAVWTGSEMIVWGGAVPACSGGPFCLPIATSTGGRFNAVTNSWTKTSQDGKPAGRNFHTAVWIGKEMIVWGGSAPKGTDGGRYCAGGAVCVPNDTTLCLNNNRFKVQAAWQAGAASEENPRAAGQAHAVKLTADTGYLWFFNSSNVEAIVKVINGCGLNQKFWFFAGGLTNVQVALTVTDMDTGSSRQYSNAQGTPFKPIQDTDAFGSCSVASAQIGAAASADRSDVEVVSLAAAEERERRAIADLLATSDGLPSRESAGASDELSAPETSPRATCTPSATALCLNGSRFKVETQWTMKQGQSGKGQAVALTSDTGYFWFFAASNVEAVFKVINGCGLNGKYWVFGGGLTDVRVVTTVTDTKTNKVKTYTNPQGTPFAPLQETAAFATCP